MEGFKRDISMDGLAEYKDMTDEEIIAKSEQDPDAVEHMIHRYKGFVRASARRYYLIGGDCDDLIQEGMIGLYKAIRDFDVSKGVPFRNFAELCVLRQMISAIKAANREKHRPLNNSISLSGPAFEDDGEKTVGEVIINARVMSPEDIYVENEKLEELEKRMHGELSVFENEVIDLYLEGRSYQEISDMLGRAPKSIDNALQRAKSKLQKLAGGAC